MHSGVRIKKTRLATSDAISLIQSYMPERASKLSCAWFVQRFVLEHSAETMQAVPNMLELVPKGVNKGSGMRKLLANLELPVEVCLNNMQRSKLLALLICIHRCFTDTWSAILMHYWITLISRSS